MLDTGQAGVICIVVQRVGLRRAGSALVGPLPWWGTESAVSNSSNFPNSSNPYNVGQFSVTFTPGHMSLRWTRSSSWCNYSTA